MKEFKKSEFLGQLLDAATRFNIDAERSPGKIPGYRAYKFARMHGLVPSGYGWEDDKRYEKMPPVCRAIQYLAGCSVIGDTDDVKTQVARYMLLQQFNEAAWEEYETLLKSHKETMSGLLAGLHSIAEENSDRAGMK